MLFRRPRTDKPPRIKKSVAGIRAKLGQLIDSYLDGGLDTTFFMKDGAPAIRWEPADTQIEEHEKVSFIAWLGTTLKGLFTKGARGDESKADSG